MIYLHTILGMETEANVPSLLAFLFGDHVIIEAGTGKKTIVGLFDDFCYMGHHYTRRCEP